MDARDFEKWLVIELGVTLTARSRKKLEEAVASGGDEYERWKQHHFRFIREKNLAAYDAEIVGVEAYLAKSEERRRRSRVEPKQRPAFWGHECISSDDGFHYGTIQYPTAVKQCHACGMERP